MANRSGSDLYKVVLAQRAMQETRALFDDVACLTVNESGHAWHADELARKCADADAVMAFMTERIDAGFLSLCPRLRIVGGALKGYDNIDIEACSAHGVWVSNVPDMLTVPTAELAVGLLIGAARHLHEADNYVRSGEFTGWVPKFYGSGLAGATVGLIGMGAIGKAIAQRLVGFDANLVFYDDLEIDLPPHINIERVEFDTLIACSDFVVLAAPLTATSLHLVDKSEISKMRQGAILVNPGRGSVVDEQAVLEALQAGHLGAYAADVFEMEDLSRPDRPKRIHPELLAHPRTLFTPHLGSAVYSVRQAIERRAAENILAVLGGKAPPDAVNAPDMRAQRIC